MRLQYGRPASRAAAAAQPDIGGAAPSERELGVPTSTPTATVLAELGEPPLYVPWLAHAVCVWNSLVTAPAGVEPADLPWAAQLATAKQLVGIEFDVQQQQQQVSPDSVRHAAMQRHLSRVAAALPQHTLLQHYFSVVRPEACTLVGYSKQPM